VPITGGNLRQESLGCKDSSASREAQLLALYSEQSKIKRNDYLEAHSHNYAVIRRHTSIFERYSRFIPTEGTVLDWGCNHAPDACLVRMLRGDAIQLYGCDVQGEEYRAFYEFADLRYTRITHPYLLPYQDNFFDVVIGSAALEHVPIDSESLKELYRIIKPGGVFIMTTLPNRLSYTEWLNRRFHRNHHSRLYSLKEAKHMFLHHGFVPIASGYHQVFPSLCNKGGIFDSRIANKFVSAIASQNKFGEKLWPIRCFASNLFAVGKKVAAI
jgi:SAM-dependent methyltransferase